MTITVDRAYVALRAGLIAGLVFVMASVVGLVTSSTVDAGEKCGAAGVAYDTLGLQAAGPPPQPFSLRCTPTVDLVPSWVNPLFYLSGGTSSVLLVLGSVMWLIAVAQLHRRR